MKIDFSIIIPHHKDEKNLENLLRSITQQSTALSFEVLVISNPPSIEANKICAMNPCFKNIDSDLVGVNIARNLGIQNATGELIIFFDSDCLLTDIFLLQKHFDYHQQYSETTCLGGSYSLAGGSIVDKAYNYIQRRWLYWGIEGDRSRYLLGGHFSCRREVFNNYLFDEKITYGGSETELFFRLNRKGFLLILNQDLLVEHVTSLNTFDLFQKLYKQGNGSWYLAEKHDYEQSHAFYNFNSVYLVDEYDNKHLKYYLYLADRAFTMGKESQGETLHKWKIKLIVLRLSFLFKIKNLQGFLRSLEVLLK